MQSDDKLALKKRRKAKRTKRNYISNIQRRLISGQKRTQQKKRKDEAAVVMFQNPDTVSLLISCIRLAHIVLVEHG